MSDMRTPLGKVRGLGSAREGTGHFWRQRLTAIANIPLILFFVGFLIALNGAATLMFAPRAQAQETSQMTAAVTVPAATTVDTAKTAPAAKKKVSFLSTAPAIENSGTHGGSVISHTMTSPSSRSPASVSDRTTRAVPV